MGGGGGGGPFTHRAPELLAQQVREAEDITAIKQFETDLSKLLADYLGSANSRDTELVSERLENIKKTLNQELEETVDTLFGGSVAKHTYVDGLSDIDSLLILNNSELAKGSSNEALTTLAKHLEEQLGKEAQVGVGRLAVTVTYKDGMEIQLLPAVREGDKVRIPSAQHAGWSSIAPRRFQEALSTRNKECANKLVPTIKLVKAVIGTLPEKQQLTGYHVESLAISAFKNYNGPNTVANMVPKFFEKAKELVKSPIRDSTGQSVHVDGYLGTENSRERLAASHVLGRIAKRMHNASANMSKDQWAALFEGT
ncbi:CBASS oligonucleotide cyclase [uncultured Sulfitobacter sp.]|uniref:CBASS oligonucleotide cyclase n=1 Tax=uncultured Sulfitobacter sp. TaxID=191468 RepID=UPI0025944609|nr:CBASS oligonucleotide cyclase [uncultured Sulfitobacter sp.]